MNNIGTIIILVLAMISAFILIGGGLYLLHKQIVIKDSVTGEMSEIDIPIFGRVKSNYPSLIALFFGPALIVYIISQLPPLSNPLLPVEGKFSTSQSGTEIFESMRINIVPQSHVGNAYSNGAFEMNIPFDKEQEPYTAHVSYRINNIKHTLSTPVKFRSGKGIIENIELK